MSPAAAILALAALFVTAARLLAVEATPTDNAPAAAEPTSPELFQRQLEAGEFAPALREARQIEQAAQRDAWLAQLAEAQAKGGEPRAAYSTLAYVGDDRARSAAIQAVRETPAPAGARGGAQADFDSLIELITTTVKPDSWDEVGGPGTVSEFRNGVYVDAHGVLQRVLQSKPARDLADTRRHALQSTDNTDSRRVSPLRKVSLPRLEKHVQLRLAAGRGPNEEMLHLAGLEKIQYVLVYPETGDLVLAGPASDWHVDDEGRTVSRASGRPVLKLDDLVVLLRYLTAAPQATFGCSINPTQEGLARTKQFADSRSSTPLKPAARGAWLRKLRHQMGRQTIEVEGIDPRTRVGRVLVEADYRMKLVGMGLEEGTPDVPSYLSLVKVGAGRSAAGFGRVAVVVHAEVRRGRGHRGPRRVRDSRPGRAGTERERAADRAGPPRAHRPERTTERGICPTIHRTLRGAGPEVSRVRRSAERRSTWRSSRR